jgi:hypothetical protein
VGGGRACAQAMGSVQSQPERLKLADHKNSVDIERLTILLNQPVIKNTLLHTEKISNIRPAFTTTVYAFLNPKLPSAAWDFFCLRFTSPQAFVLPTFSTSVAFPGLHRANPHFFDYYCLADFHLSLTGVHRCWFIGFLLRFICWHSPWVSGPR